MDVSGTSLQAGEADDLRHVLALADACAGMLRVAGGLANSDRTLDLAGFDHEIGRLCAAALDLPPDRGRIVRPQLIELCQGLDRLAETLRRNARPCGTDPDVG